MGGSRPVATKKRSAPGPKTGSVSSTTQKAAKGRIPDETNRPQTAQRVPLATRASFEAPRRATSTTYASTFPELQTLDMSPTNSDVMTTPNHSGPYIRHGSQTESPSHLYKLDAMMFPSADPFAYPNQPLLDFSPPPNQGASHSQQISTSNTQDSRNFYMPLYGDIEGQIMGPIPSYLMSQGHGQNGLDLSAQMYPPPNTLTLQQAQAQHHAQQQQQQQNNHNRGGELDEMMADAGFNKGGNWGDMFFRPL